MADRIAPPPAPAISISRTSTKSRASSKKSTRAGSLSRSVTSPDSPASKAWFYNAKAQFWKKRHEPEPVWHTKWEQGCFGNGRVFIIDYISNDVSNTTPKPRRRHVAVASQEFESLRSLKAFYANQSRAHDAALRVIHVQNATWATEFLLSKFNIDHPNDLVGLRSFGQWARCESPRQRNGKPFPNGRTFQTQTDPWREVSCTAFGLDYLKCYATSLQDGPRSNRRPSDRLHELLMMHLNAYEDSRNPRGYDVAVQRLSVYVQRSLGPDVNVAIDPSVKSPYERYCPNQKVVKVDDLDNTSTVIVFETSASRSLEDCLVQPRNDFEKRWRRLSFYLRKEDVLNDARLAAQCTNFILGDVFHALAVIWDEFLAAATDHVNMLEDKIYENPADESRAPELWTNQAAWLKVDKVMYMHQDIVKEMQGLLRLTNPTETDDESNDRRSAIEEWLVNTPAEYEKLGHMVQEDLVQPTTNLSDLMYKSVGIRDSRQSLQASLSMWRLSWITFLFLPLTFIVSFFGMNVDIFENYPNVGWYFLAAAILMIGVLAMWYCVKHSLQRRRQTPFQRGMYETLFHGLENDYPTLWTASGALDDVKPRSFIHRIQWKLLKRWFAPERTINRQIYSSLDEEGADLGTVDRFKRHLLRRWLPQLAQDSANVQTEAGDIELNMNVRLPEDGVPSSSSGAIDALAKTTTPIAVVQAEPWAMRRFSHSALHPLTSIGEMIRNGSPQRGSDDRPSSRGSSGVIIEERNFSDSESDTAGGAATGSASGAHHD